MEAVTLKLSQDVARDALRKYREHRAAATPDDEAIMRAYREIARGRVVIQAFESIRRAGFNEQGLPRLAIIRAHASHCWYQAYSNFVEFAQANWAPRRGQTIRMPWAGLPEFALNKRAKAIVPSIPLYLRPKSNLRSYYILWEADWRAVPNDPMLLRKLSGDLWLVVAAWDLSEVERAVLAGRVSAV